MQLLFLLSLLTALFSPLARTDPAPPPVKLKPVTAALYTRWAQTPLLVEASEFFFDESPTLFWSFLSRVQAHLKARTQGPWTDEQQHDLAVEISQTLLSPVKQNFLGLALALRFYSARVQMYRQIVETENITRVCADVLVDFGDGMHACGLEEVKAAWTLTSDLENPEKIKKPQLISVDHHYPGSRDAKRTVIVYGNILRPEFWAVHELLVAHTDQVRYIFRHYADSRDLVNVSKIRIPGYGVEMAIKSTEYKAQDDSKIKEGDGALDEQTDEVVDEELDTDIEGFDFGKLKSRLPEKKDQLEQLKSFLLLSSGTELQQLKAWQYQDLSLQAAEKSLRVASLHGGSSTDALRTLRDISQNFPTQAPTLLKIPVREDVKAEIERNREFFAHYHSIEAGGAALFVNGIQHDTDVTDIYVLFEKLREENRLMESLHGFGIQGPDMTSILELDLHPTGGAKYGIDIRHPAVHFVNDLEKDKRYAEWPTSVRELVRQSFPPTLLKAIRRNFYNLILVVDPAEMKANHDILQLTESFYVHKLPIRVGLVFITTDSTDSTGLTDPSIAMYNAYRYMQEKKTPQAALSFLTDVYYSKEAKEKGSLTPEIVIDAFKAKFPQETLEEVFGAGSQYEEGRNDGRKFLEKLNINQTPTALLNGVLLDGSRLNADEFENEVLQNLVAVYGSLQRDVMSGSLTDYSDVVEFLMSKPHIVPRLNSLILAPSEYRILDFSGQSLDPERYTFANFEALKSADKVATMASASFYLTKHEEGDAHPVTLWIVTDPETAAGRELLYAAVKHSKASNDVRIGIIYNPSESSLAGDLRISKAIQVALETQPMNLARNFITKLLKEENVAEIAVGTKTLQDFEVNGMDMVAFNSGLEQVSTDFLKIHSSFAQHELNLKPGETGAVANGYVVGPLQKDFGADDIDLLEKYIESYGAVKLSNELHRLHIFPSGEKLSDVVMMTSALLSGLGSTEDAKKRTKVLYSENENSIINIESRNPQQPAFDISFIVDPVSKEAQKIIPVLMVLHEALNCRIRVLMNCRDKLSELPLKSFYRMVLEPRLTFTDNGSISPNFAVARFPALPQTALLTMNLLPPDNWLTEATSAVHDLDNIRLEEVDGWGVYGGFELMNLLLEGSAKDQSNEQPPRGTQFILGTSSNPNIVDTIVMANLGYFQFKANPGSWTIKLREGRSRDIYAIASSDGAEKDGTDEEQLRVVLGSFSTKMMKIYVKKRIGMEKEDVLSDPKAAGVEKIAGTGILDSISNYWSPEEKKALEASGSDDVINIFSLASGHLYERFLRLMMLSVVKNTKTPVKFWFLKNYLSPQFKEFIPFMAARYNFQFELVEYKWPRWLHHQSEKQRVIWGYKILFLDVLFPLSVKKIIFVDADQIVRTDMKELRDLDLEGAPYGYTPFCESRKEMEGFRFWKNGYWASHLGHRRYHISALYVVDLVRFRKIAAGDRLRAQYQGLSQDPNSLSNLDQDLPNNMIYQVPIKSLPQEWLWCETWCDDASKVDAKTIDLCNNPLTKEPKLTAAMRIIPEWKAYDEEVRRLQDEFQADKKRLSGGGQGAEPRLSGAGQGAEPMQPVLEDDSENDVFVHSRPAAHGGEL
ncbi:UDP-glucose:glycoprotein glucosyltransferase 1 [Hypsibius exemplaris]|uniref:UDP-glucose:glycoprotein glucosyltransferase 1 n=1 Tax=Hypsibius exemplaris TaxID=2072580 RepID=A0A1W0WCK1_HYPEX|nr:UDP-glucose:glycoprotein glucosyltransferase 1 [Hypsibius exemplaris]